MIADLLQAAYELEDKAASLDGREVFPQLVDPIHRPLVERGLFGGELGVPVELDLVG